MSIYRTDYLSSYFNKTNRDEIINKNENDLNSKIQQLFNNCINFFTSEGLKSLLNRIETITIEIFSEITLIKELSSSEMSLLFEKFKSKMEDTTRLKNFSELIIPISTVCFNGGI